MTVPVITWACQGLGQSVSGKGQREEGEAARITSGDQSSSMFRASPCFYMQHKSGCHPRAPHHPHSTRGRCQGREVRSSSWDIREPGPRGGLDGEGNQEGLWVFFFCRRAGSNHSVSPRGRAVSSSVGLAFLPVTVWTGWGNSGHEPRTPAQLSC